VKVDELGFLKLRGNFTISNGTSDREYVLYLFQNMLICCQEKKQEKKKKGKEKVKITYVLKGSIYISSVVRVSNKSVPSENIFALKIYWNDKKVKRCFVIKGINEEQINLWITQISDLIDIEERKNETLRRNHYHNHDYNKHYNSRVNQVDDMLTMDAEHDKSIVNPYSFYGKASTRSGFNTTPLSSITRNLSRSKSQPNIYHSLGITDPRLNKDKSGSKDTSINRSITDYHRKNDRVEFTAPQRTVSNHVKHNHSMSSLKHYPKYSEPGKTIYLYL